jgi:hypothetical protein
MKEEEGKKGKEGFKRRTAKQTKKKLEILSRAFISNLKNSVFYVGSHILFIPNSFHNKIYHIFKGYSHNRSKG